MCSNHELPATAPDNHRGYFFALSCPMVCPALRKYSFHPLIAPFRMGLWGFTLPGYSLVYSMPVLSAFGWRGVIPLFF
jgi:hypothetical protein